MAQPAAPDVTTHAGPAPQPAAPVFPPPSAPSQQPTRLSFDAALSRRGAVDGGWWPQSRNATAELPGLVAALDSRPEVHVRRLSVHVDEWDDIPRRVPAGDGHVIRVDSFSTIPRHTISVTADAHDMINLLVIPSGTAAAPAQAAMDAAMTGRGDPAAMLAGTQQATAHQPGT